MVPSISVWAVWDWETKVTIPCPVKAFQLACEVLEKVCDAKEMDQGIPCLQEVWAIAEELRWCF